MRSILLYSLLPKHFVVTPDMHEETHMKSGFTHNVRYFCSILIKTVLLRQTVLILPNIYLHENQI
jgi:hypothetical protein